VTARQYDKARQFFEKSLKYAQEVEDGFGIYLRHYDLGDSYLNEAGDDCCTDRNRCYQNAMEHFEKGLEVVENLDESKKEASLYHLYAGLLLSSAMCEAWGRYNLYGEKLQTLVQKGIWFSWLAGQIHDAVTAGEEHAGDWVNELKKKETA
jgi:tetratricopeptide (TPR) repeat protein